MSNSEMPGLPASGSDKKPEGSEKSEGSEKKNSPSLEDGKPKIVEPGKTRSEIKIPKGSKGILVVANRKGFYNQQRLAPGDKFIIKGKEHFGTWFTCVDPVQEAKRKEFIEDKKAKR